MPLARHFLWLLVQVVWASLLSTRHQSLLTVGWLKQLIDNSRLFHSCWKSPQPWPSSFWASALHGAVTVLESRPHQSCTQLTKAKQRAHTLNTAQEPLLSQSWSLEGHHTPAGGFHSSYPGKVGGKVSPGWLFPAAHSGIPLDRLELPTGLLSVVEITPLCSHFLWSALGACIRMGWILL